MADLGNFVKIVSAGVAGGGPYTVTQDLPLVGDVTVTDTSSSETFVIPAPAIARMLEDADGTTSVELSQTTAANGGDQILFTVDGAQVGSVEILAGGLTKWTLDGILDPIVYAGTPQTTAQRDALTPSAGYMVYNATTSQYEYYNGSTWLAMSGTSPGGATDVVAGLVELATPAEVTAGTDTARAVTPAGLKVELDKKEGKVDATVFQAVGSENTLGINTDDDTLQKIAVKLNAYIAEGGIDPWEAGKVYTDADLFTFSTTNTTAIDVNGNKIVSGESYIGKYPGGATSGATLTNAEMLLIEVVSDAKQDEGLRGAPVADNATLTALPARDYERRKVLADGKEYVFELGAFSGTLADDGATGFWKEQISELKAIKVDASAGGVTTYLPSSANSGAVRLYININVDNSAGLDVQPGETLNGVVNSGFPSNTIFTFSNYPVGTQFRVDEVLGGWVISVVGTPSNSQLSHLLAIRSADIVIDTLDVGDAIPFDTEVSKIGSNISFDPLTGIFTLKAGGTYRLSADLSLTADGGEIEDTYQFYNVNTSSFIGARGHFKDFAGDSSPKPSNPVAVISPTIDTQIILSPTGNVDNNTGALQEHSWMEVMEIPSAEVVLAGMVTPEPLAYYLARWDQAQVFNQHPSVVLTTSQTTNIVDNNDKTWTVDGGLFEIEWNPALDQAASSLEQWITVDGANAGVPGNYMTADQPNPDNRGVARVIVDATGGPKVISYTLATSALNVSNQAFISIKQLPSSTVVMPAASEIEVADQAASGYMDIGTMRMQWGIGSAQTTITLPVPFANANYSISGICTSGISNLFNPTLGNITSTSFFANLWNTNGGGGIGGTVRWIAIGLRP